MSLVTNIKDVERKFKAGLTKIDKESIRALNKSGRDSHPEAKRIIRAGYNIKAGAINRAKKIRRASSQKPTYLLEYKASRTNVKEFGLRQTRAGITWKVKKGLPFKLQSGFKVGHKMKSPPARKIPGFGMIRTGRFTSSRLSTFKGSSRRRKLATAAGTRTTMRTSNARREIIKSITGPSVSQLLNNKKTASKLNIFFRNKYDKFLAEGIR